MSRKSLRLFLGLFVVAFAAFVAVSLHRGARQGPPPAPVKRLDPNAQLQTIGGGEVGRLKEGKPTVSIKFGTQLSYPDGRTKLMDGVKMTLPDKNGRTVVIESRQANLMVPPDRDIGQADFTGGVTLTTSDGVVVKTADASYSDSEAIAKIPGPLTFSKGRMHGTGVGATYDRNREVLWILKNAVIDVTPDDKGVGTAHMTANMAGMARVDHFVKLAGDAKLDGEGHQSQSAETTIYLTEDNERITRMELRGGSKIAAAPGSQGGPQTMSARDIDVLYAEDGRTLQHAHLVENASVQLPGDPGQAGRRVAAKTIDIALAPDGATVTNLTGMDAVQVDLPGAREVPARRIKAQSLVAFGAPPPAPGQPGGLRNATFGGGVDYHESRAAKKTLSAINRSARSDRLEVQTKPGFGDVEKADFRGNVHFTDGTDTAADAPVALYDIAADRLDLGPPIAGETGGGPHMRNDRLQVDAAHISMTLSSQSMKADTAVRSLLQPQQDKSGKSDTHMPSMLKPDKPVNVRANRLDYDGTNDLATYSGNARLWQDDTTIQADKIVLDDKTGNLHATVGVRTIMTLTESGDDKSKPAQPKAAAPPSQQTTTVAEELVYEDATHKATYTTKAHMNGPDGDVTADKIELYLAEQGGELERAEAFGNVVSRQETRLAKGDHLTYISAKDEYTMVGAPVKVYDNTPPNCKLTTGATLMFHKASDTITSVGNETANTKTESITCGTVGPIAQGAHGAPARERSGASGSPRATEPGCGAEPHED